MRPEQGEKLEDLGFNFYEQLRIRPHTRSMRPVFKVFHTSQFFFQYLILSSVYISGIEYIYISIFKVVIYCFSDRLT